jgi:hypothetical protein
MKLFEEHNEEGELVYFEVPNTFLSRKSAVKIIKGIPNVVILKEEKREDVFCTFRLGDKVFEIMEPFGDNSRYHIGEAQIQNSRELEIIKQEFSVHKPELLSLFHR